jgi:diadenosine tetraphosphate (Ap4A) HIT family hydrolase
MTKVKDCPFCNTHDRVLKENELAQVILSNPRKVPGHFLVIPKRHVEKPWELKPEELTAIFELIFFIEQKIIGKLGDGANIRQNYLPFVTENKVKVDHVHFHVIPRALNDYLYTIAEQYEDGLFAKLDDLEAKAVSELLK